MTTQAKVVSHTPGPWEFDDSGEYYERGVIRHNGLIVASIPTMGIHGQGRREREADARLISAAPELLALVRAHLMTYPLDEYADTIAAVLGRIQGA